MALELVTIPCLSDNYTFLMHCDETGDTAVIDTPESAPIAAELERRGWTLTHVLLTHHHYDHVDGLEELKADYPDAVVVGAAADANRLPPLDIKVKEGDTVTVGIEWVRVLDVSGHTEGHIAYHFPESEMAFTGDSLMALGCGRLFEGTPQQMFDSLTKLAALSPDTLICSGHEYTMSNAKFALSVEPGNAALQARAAETEAMRARGEFTVPSRLQLELDTNPFLRWDSAEIQASVGLPGDDPVAVFAATRAAKDNF
ncbi:hydroxyacylglutathione hydrolase [Alisedimentitalea sp. MJ-SS2]|uniref:hydroxyacylglutathione hydrolase n=1 Tax=Aliisedimentitalea sp. MJ-SS2 TaxID=3049795 RepID=UPI0029105034|nr:hydroxyacylglutathione hydrolase [Alisedimentitalea sp. MJ-SS2]MDU8927290.1 hydroxyacylglutathione hydrolase [Alisedimentitalea sp. MJ-SS2]